jgi:hypothetical protein
MYSFHLKGGLLSALALLLCLAACNPVQFSADTGSNDGKATPTDPGPTDPTDPTTPTTPTEKTRDVDYTNVVEAKTQKVDLVLIVDDSTSMIQDNRRLATRLSGFVSNLASSSIDWQMCVTTTRALPVSSTEKLFGASVMWQSNAASPSATLGYILTPRVANLSTIFSQTIEYIGTGKAGSADERGIKSAYHHAIYGNYNNSGGSSGCYRDGAAIAYILISDEDERSVGGDQSQEQYPGQEYFPLEDDDKPANLVTLIKDTFGATKRFTYNSIIVKPDDTACKATQDTEGSYSHYGKRYSELSTMTSGGISSICAADFSTNLNLFFERINDSLSSVPLECMPIGDVTVTITPSMTVTTRIDGMNLIFETAVPAGRTINLKYKCPDRTPSSAAKAVPYGQQQGLWTRVVNFFKNLF